mmetsp:Transcript_8578/g.16572  ORF Transcript_8578/g.16572 Transcript_8578/m.16572 type:complete len:227 (+) Transcript_8578:1068-1748(+)
MGSVQIYGWAASHAVQGAYGHHVAGPKGENVQTQIRPRLVRTERGGRIRRAGHKSCAARTVQAVQKEGGPDASQDSLERAPLRRAVPAQRPLRPADRDSRREAAARVAHLLCHEERRAGEGAGTFPKVRRGRDGEAEGDQREASAGEALGEGRETEVQGTRHGDRHHGRQALGGVVWVPGDEERVGERGGTARERREEGSPEEKGGRQAAGSGGQDEHCHGRHRHA